MTSRRRCITALCTAGAFVAGLARPAAAEETSNIALRADVSGVKLQQLTGTADIWLGGRAGTADLWTDLCTAPCGLASPAGVQLRVAGDGVETSAPFLPTPGKDVTVSVKAGSQGKRVAGATLAIVGLGAALAGGAMLGAAGAMEPPADGALSGPPFDEANARMADQAATLRAVAITSLAAGALGLLIGIPLYAANRTQVELD